MRIVYASRLIIVKRLPAESRIGLVATESCRFAAQGSLCAVILKYSPWILPLLVFDVSLDRFFVHRAYARAEITPRTQVLISVPVSLTVGTRLATSVSTCLSYTAPVLPETVAAARSAACALCLDSLLPCTISTARPRYFLPQQALRSYCDLAQQYHVQVCFTQITGT